MADTSLTLPTTEIPGMPEALERMKPENWPGEPGVMKSVLNELAGQIQRVVLPTQEVLRNSKAVIQSPIALATAVPLVQNLRINRAMEELSSIPEGKTLVEAAVGTKVSLDSDPRRSGGSNCFFTRYTGGKVRMDSNGISVNGY
ncbi:MAG TPA: hypothetical protein VEF76_14705, partial [Patescibacteria group bacterium]|nr:hypothetical protein [Patescibacteria group bacterium]